jgi:NADH-quinone oxidoreductase subunit C
VAGTPHPLSPDETASRLRAHFGEDIVDAVDQHGHAVATVTVDRFHDVCRFLRDEPDFACDYCDFTGAVDFGPEGASRCDAPVLDHASPQRAVKVKLPHEDPMCPTISDLFPTSNWHERETIEMFGISFEDIPSRSSCCSPSRSRVPAAQGLPVDEP